LSEKGIDSLQGFCISSVARKVSSFGQEPITDMGIDGEFGIVQIIDFWGGMDIGTQLGDDHGSRSQETHGPGAKEKLSSGDVL